MSVPSRVLVLLTILSFLCAGLAQAEPTPTSSEKRIALVIGNAAYKAGELATPANDAGLVAQTLQAAGFDVVGARDLDEDALRRALREFADKAAASGPDTVAFVYLAGYGLQLNGENYFVPVDAQIATAADVPVRALRLSDYKRQLAAVPLKARFVVFDAGRTAPFAKTGDPLAGGLALTEAEPGSLVAFNAAPGTVGPQEKGSYGAYAQALVEMIREGGLAPAELFDRVRLRVSETTQGGEVPWSASRIEGAFEFFKRAADAPPIADPAKVAALRERPLREIGPQDAYAACLQRDTIQGYQEFVSAYPRDGLAKRVRLLIAARREALTWRRTYLADDPDGYWSYLSRYPRGPHAWDARRRLRELAAALEPPPRFAMLDYDVPPPPPEEILYVERPFVYFDDPYYNLTPPPPPPAFFLPPRPAYIVDLAPPPPVYVAYALPAPAFVPLPVYVSAPVFLAPPPNNVYYQNIHNVTVINEINRQNVDFARERRGPSALAVGAGAAAGAAAGLAISRVALPPTLQQRAALPANTPTGGGGPASDPRLRPGNFGNQGLPNGQSGQPQQGLGPGRAAVGPPLPGQNGQPLPQQANRPVQTGQPPQGLVPGSRPGQPQQAFPVPNGQQPPSQQAVRPGQPMAAPFQQMQINRPAQPGQGPAPNGRPVVGQGQSAANAPPQQAVRPGQPPAGTSPNAIQQQADQQGQMQQQQQAAQQRAAAQQQANQQRLIQQQQSAQQRAAAQQQQAAQQRAALQQQAVQQRQMQQQANQQRAAAQQQQAAQQRQMMMQQQQAAQQRAMQQQMAQQRQMQAQQQAAQRQQMMARPQPQPQQPHAGGRPPCPPGVPCR